MDVVSIYNAVIKTIDRVLLGIDERNDQEKKPDVDDAEHEDVFEKDKSDPDKD